jgi:hypothetical protein
MIAFVDEAQRKMRAMVASDREANCIGGAVWGKTRALEGVSQVAVLQTVPIRLAIFVARRGALAVPSRAEGETRGMKEPSGVGFCGWHEKWTGHDQRNCTQVGEALPVIAAASPGGRVFMARAPEHPFGTRVVVVLMPG